MYAQFVTLILPVALTFIRRKCPKLLTCLLLHLALPACIHPLLYLFFYLTESFDLINNLTIHVVLILVMYIVMRQIAVFDEKYYHSIRRSSKPAALLKKQNYKTAVGLIVVFAISVLVLLVFPVEEMTKRFPPSERNTRRSATAGKDARPDGSVIMVYGVRIGGC